MRSVSTITNLRALFNLLIFSILVASGAAAQENSPYSRYGIGDILPAQNVLNRAMGGMSIAYYDLQSINFNNPATYARLKLTTFDVGLEYDSRRIRSSNTTNNFKSAYLIPTYVNVGFPLSKKKNWGMNVGLKPISRINYDVISRTRIGGIDSVYYNYVGTGGTYQIFTGIGYGTNRLAIGVNAGWMFGNKNYSTRMLFINDTTSYQKARYTDSTNFGGFFLKGGIQYQFPISGSINLRVGATYSAQANLDAKRDITRETFEFGSRGDFVVDSVYRQPAVKGSVTIPQSMGAGFLLEKVDKWQLGIEYNSTQWSELRYYGEPDLLKDNWTIRMGAQIIPGIASKNYWSRVAYRAGFYYGTDYVDLGQDLNTWAFTFGAGLPIRRNFYTNQYTTLNTTFEIGARGTKENSVRDNFFRVTLGFNLSDIWFNKREYQ